MSDNASKAEQQFVIFRLQAEEFGIEINKVREIVPMFNITRLPSAADNQLAGVINLRGQVIPVISLSTLFELPAQPSLPKTARIVVTEVNKLLIGLIVDEVPEVLKIATEDIVSAPEIIRQKKTMDFIQSVGKLGDRLIIILDLVKLMQPHENMIKEADNG